MSAGSGVTHSEFNPSKLSPAACCKSGFVRVRTA
jgi:redox-sensitive bicupin YhaK (pirin superfamily)